MHRIDADGNVNGKFSDGNPEQGSLATVIDAKWLNDIQEEICNLLEDNGVNLDSDNDEQLKTLFHDLIRGHYVAQWHRNPVDIDASGLRITTSPGYGIDINSDEASITVDVENEIKTVIDGEGVKSGAGLFDVLGVNNSIAIGRSGLVLAPIDNQDSSQACVAFNGHFNVGSLENPRSISVFGPIAITGDLTSGGRVSGNFLNVRKFVNVNTPSYNLYSVNSIDGTVLTHGDLVFVRNVGTSNLSVYMMSGRYVVVYPTCGMIFARYELRNSQGGLINMFYAPMQNTEIFVD